MILSLCVEFIDAERNVLARAVDVKSDDHGMCLPIETEVLRSGRLARYVLLAGPDGSTRDVIGSAPCILRGTSEHWRFDPLDRSAALEFNSLDVRVGEILTVSGPWP